MKDKKRITKPPKIKPQQKPVTRSLESTSKENNKEIEKAKKIVMTKSELKEKVKELITNVQPYKALELIQKFASESKRDYSQLENAIMMQKAAFNRAKKQNINGIVTGEQFNREIAKVNYATNEIADQVDDDDDVNVNDDHKPDSKIKILFLTANPESSQQLRLDKEIRRVKNGFKSATLKGKFEFISEPAVTMGDITSAMMNLFPDIVHFSGHGVDEKGLVIEGDDGKQKYFPTEGLEMLFGLPDTRVECVLLNACYSEDQAKVISEGGNGIYAIGMNDAVGDTAAIAFSVGFYQALGEGRDYKYAFKIGLIHTSSSGTSALDKPQLWFKGKNISPA